MSVLLTQNIDEGTFFLDNQPFQKGRYRYTQKGERIAIHEIGRDSRVSIIDAPVFFFIDDATGLPYLDVQDLIDDLNEFLFFESQEIPLINPVPPGWPGPLVTHLLIDENLDPLITENDDNLIHRIGVV